MAREARTAVIGAFVLGAAVLAAVGLAALGSGSFLGKRPICVMYFSGSITGLSVGSPVMFRGVRVGAVKEISAVFDPGDLSITIPVYVEFYPESFRVADPEHAEGEGDPFSDDRFYRPLLDKGLKAQLELQSLVTQQLYVALDFHPEAPAKLLGLDPDHPEIPTIPSLREQIVETVKTLPEKIISVVDGVDRWLRSTETQESLREVAGTMRDVGLLAQELRSEVKPLATSLMATSQAARRTLAQAEKTLALKEGPSAELAARLIEATRKAGASLDELRAMLAAFQQVAQRNAHVGYDVSRTLSELEATSRAVRSLVDYLELHPEALLKGRN